MKNFRKLLFFAILIGTYICSGQSMFKEISGIPSLTTNQEIKLHYLLDSSDRYKSHYFIEVNSDSTALDSSGNFVVDLPGILPFSIKYEINRVDLCPDASGVISHSSSLYINANWFHVATSSGDTLYQYSSLSLLRYSGENFIGTIELENRQFDIHNLGNGLQVLCEVDKNSELYSAGRSCGITNSGSSTDAIQSLVTDCNNKIKILIVYTTNSLKNQGLWNGSLTLSNDIQAHADLAIQDLNTIWANSQVQKQAFLAGVRFLDIGESGSYSVDVQQTLPNDLTIAGWRSALKADIVCQMTGHYTGIFGTSGCIGCGDIDSAFVIVDATASTGGHHTFAHEVCHILGARHNLAFDATPGNAHAHYFKTGAGIFNWGGIKRYTLMQVIFSNEATIPHLSNKDVTFMNIPTGLTTANNAPAAVTPNSDVIDDFFIDNTGDINFHRINCTNFQMYWWAEFKNFCPSQEFQGPFTVEWFRVWLMPTGVPTFPFFPTYVSLGTGNGTWIYIPYSDSKNFVIVAVVSDGNNQQITLASKFISGRDAQDNCALTRSSQILGLDDQSLDELKISPNPTNGDINIAFPKSITSNTIQISIYSIDGRCVHSENMNADRVSSRKYDLHLSKNLSNGLYVLKLQSPEAIYSKKIQIER